ncbi:hypothetical protein K7432_010413 [Basidiobolus ranarum]|uniref:SET domain-containing protein n=1 Tax=Basidiobolus ranarum TaxID=34480 RepID=A0ABR2WNU3_9FUNG
MKGLSILLYWVFLWHCPQLQARSVSLDPQFTPKLEVPGTYVYQHFYAWDYLSQFNLTYLNCVVRDPDIEEWVVNSEPLKQVEEEFLKENENVWDLTHNIYTDLCENRDLYETKELDSLPKVYIRWVNSLVKWGLFAEEPIPPKTTIGLYTGFLTNKTTNFDYSWEYNVYTQVYDKDEESVLLAIDALEVGNHLRFVNHNEESINVSPFYAARDNIWWIFYIATKPIEINQQLLTDYGKSYWESEEDEEEGEGEEEEGEDIAEHED